jgi:hypothetical protein
MSFAVGQNRQVLVSVLDPSSASPNLKADDAAYRAFRQISAEAQLIEQGSIKVVDDHREADVVIVPASTKAFGHRLQALQTINGFAETPHKFIVYVREDIFHFPLPGVYPACTSYWKSTGWALPSHFISDHLPKWNYSRDELTTQRDLLFSFIGEFRTHPVRNSLGSLTHERGLVLDVSQESNRWWDRSWEEQRPFKDRFRESLLRSKFVLCPRGVIPNSMRIFDAIQAGAIPVLIADGLVLPEGPRWSEFTVAVREKDVQSIPARLESLEPRAHEMGVAARAAWESYFSPERSFTSLVSWALTIRDNLQTQTMTVPRVWSRIQSEMSPRRLRKVASNIKRRLLPST